MNYEISYLISRKYLCAYVGACARLLVFMQAKTHVYHTHTHTHTHNSFDFLELSFPLLKSVSFIKQNFIFQIQVFNKTL